MRKKLLHLPRPSAAMTVAVTALFVAMGGAGYAAVLLPANSVGTAQLQHSSVVHSKLRFDSVNFQDIVPGSVGTVRANLAQLQARVNATCGQGTAIGTVENNGHVNCNATRPAEFGTTGTVPVPTALTSVASVNLPSGSSYMAFANPTASNSSGSAEDVTCSLTLGANKQTRTVSLPGNGGASIPLQVAGPSGLANVSCSTASGDSTVTAAINALETSVNN